jgi:hypothetical protein
MDWLQVSGQNPNLKARHNFLSSCVPGTTKHLILTERTNHRVLSADLNVKNVGSCKHCNELYGCTECFK